MNNLSVETYPVEVAVAVAQYSDRTYFLPTSASSIPKKNSRSYEQTEQRNNTVQKVTARSQVKRFPAFYFTNVRSKEAVNKNCVLEFNYESFLRYEKCLF